MNAIHLIAVPLTVAPKTLVVALEAQLLWPVHSRPFSESVAGWPCLPYAAFSSRFLWRDLDPHMSWPFRNRDVRRGSGQELLLCHGFVMPAGHCHLSR